MKSLTYRTTPTPVLDLLPSLIAPKTNRPLLTSCFQIRRDTIRASANPGEHSVLPLLSPYECFQVFLGQLGIRLY